ncbi:hypothetical protein EHS13_05665 [Paenibacillus psychroresistens]|uniref:Uncharacterized protein n=1 Tax=Paenibacillus psychroresistens TaxID=1778678 RepID=A0A6B8RER8_9BACL|nr:hypothetical protein [Paenibacillus psychroresistens]QGQ94427.1 hypothetical protein EHS13_05665 [Paenibacillus psychroresistens]
MRYTLCLVIASLLIVSGCKGDQSAKKAEQDIVSLNIQLEAIKADLEAKQNATTEAQQQTKDKQQYIDSLTRDYEDLLYLICSEANTQCPGELKYFDPRKIKQGDVILGMKVKTIEVSTFGPGSYIVSFAETVDVTGKFTVSQDDPMGPYMWLDTDTINGKKFSINLGVGGNQDELQKALKGSEKGEIRLKLKDITLQRLPQKPAYNVAGFVSLDK